MILADFFPDLSFTMCTGCSGMRQVEQSCCFTIETCKGVPTSKILESSGELLNLTNPNVFIATPLTYAGRFRQQIKDKGVKPW